MSSPYNLDPRRRSKALDRSKRSRAAKLYSASHARPERVQAPEPKRSLWRRIFQGAAPHA